MRNHTIFVFALVWAILVVFAVHFLEFPGSVPNFRAVSGGGMLLDATPAFTPEAIYQRLTAYGEVGRRNYSFRNVTVDILLPLSVLPFLFLLMFRALALVPQRRFVRALLCSLPFAYVTFDFVENATILSLLANYPNRLDGLARTLPYTTIIKRAMSLLALAIPLGLLGFQFVRTRLAKKTHA